MLQCKAGRAADLCARAFMLACKQRQPVLPLQGLSA
jgi:hypothetical protein